MLITNVKELKEAIKDLPDDMWVAAYNGDGDLHQILGYESEDDEGKGFVINCD